jgi:hypothetical protein
MKYYDGDMDEKMFLRYVETHSESERALFSKAMVAEIYELNDDHETAEAVSNGIKEWFSIDMREDVKEIRAKKKVIKKQDDIKEEMYYIQNGYVGNAILWWAMNSKGYTTDFTNAGKYTKEQAEKIIERPQDIAWKCSYVDNCIDAQKLIIDGQYLDGKYKLVGKIK